MGWREKVTNGVMTYTKVRKCQSRYYDKKENMVCICNATYCDDIPEVGNLQALQAAIYKTDQRGKRFERTVSSFTEKKSGNVSRKRGVICS
ncbi:unnamed protein product [Onchocerca flexuosa]|uniref:Glucosylceramidase n=1 Tax=Onchocerca flexuosa TaxID=387005 RepID=A0A183HM05_9BILA|nr:unnamed protein product [Onchocerca flexuosa]